MAVVRTSLVVTQRVGTAYRAVEDLSRSTGSRYWVDSATGSDTPGFGASPDTPADSLDYAPGLVDADSQGGKGSIIYTMPGHAETRTVTGTWVALDVAGTEVMGLATGPYRPTFTFSHTGAAWTVTANGVSVENILFVAGVDSITAPVTVSGSDATFRNCEFRDTTDIEAIRWIITTAAADRLIFEDCLFNGYLSGNAAVNAIRLVGCDGAIFRRCRFHGLYSTAAVEFHTTASSKVVFDRCVFHVAGTTDLSKNIVDTVGGSSWVAIDCWDLSAGVQFSGGSGSAIAADDISAVTSALYGTAGITTWPASAAAGNGVSIAESLRYVEDALVGSAGVVTWASGAAPANGVSISEGVRFISEAITDGAAFSQTVDPGGTARTSVELVLADLGAMLAGSAGVTTFPAGAVAGNSVSLAEVLRYTQENVANGGTTLPSGDSLFGILAGASGITTWPASAAPANGVSLAEALRWLDDAVQGASGVVTFPAGAVAANGVSLAEVLRYAQENVANGGTVLPSGDSLFGVLAGASGITTWPAAAAPANGVSIAEALRWLDDAVQGANGVVTYPAAAAPANGVSIAEVLREQYDQQEKAVTNTTAALVNGTTVFTIAGGPIEILSLVARCVTANDATASTLQWSADPTDGGAATFSGASASLASLTAGAMVVLQGGTLGTAPVVNTTGVGLGQSVTNGIVVGAGIITTTVGVGSTTGTWQHHLRYRPLSRGVTVS